MTSSKISEKLGRLLVFVGEALSLFHLKKCVKNLMDSSEKKEEHKFETEKEKINCQEQ